MASTAHTVTARKARSCDQYPRCYNRIRPGDEYARHVVFPGDDANNGTRPLVLCLCRPCHTEYGREMPPRRTTKAPVPAPERNEP